MRSVLDDRGIPTTPFAARQLTEAQVASSRLILTMTLEQRSAVVALSPAAARRTFTVLELASLVTDAPELGSRMPAARLDEVLAWAGSHRGIQVLHHADRELEIADPLGHGMAAFVAAYEQIDTAIARLALALSATL
jgi:protein-tyrosine phosphatase